MQVSGAVRHLDRAKLIDPTDRTHRLYPAAIETGRDAINLVKRVVAIFLRPQRAAQRIEIHPKAVAYAVSKHFSNVHRGFAVQGVRDIEERVIGGRGAVVVEPQNYSGEVRVVRLWSTKLIVGNGTTACNVLKETAPAVIAEDDVKLAVRTETHHAAVVITARRLTGVLLQRAQLDQIAIERQSRTIPDVTIDTIAEQRYLIRVRGVGAGAALSPEEVNKTVLRETRMQRDPEQTALGSIVDREIERRAVQRAVDDALHPARRSFQHEKIIWSKKRDADWLLESGDNGADCQVVVQDRR